jgi:hypothetical protein
MIGPPFICSNIAVVERDFLDCQTHGFDSVHIDDLVIK